MKSQNLKHLKVNKTPFLLCNGVYAYEMVKEEVNTLTLSFPAFDFMTAPSIFHYENQMNQTVQPLFCSSKQILHHLFVFLKYINFGTWNLMTWHVICLAMVTNVVGFSFTLPPCQNVKMFVFIFTSLGSWKDSITQLPNKPQTWRLIIPY